MPGEFEPRAVRPWLYSDSNGGDATLKLPAAEETPMSSRTEYLVMHTTRPRDFVNLTERVRRIVQGSEVWDGLVLVSSMHITAAVYVNDNESGLLKDIAVWADRLAPPGDYEHHRTGESNGDAHLKNLLLGHQVVLPVTKGDLDLGPWEQIFYAEFDGQRPKRVLVKVVGDPRPEPPRESA
jgi:secondary thiamine-phosphate synthase enzyme